MSDLISRDDAINAIYHHFPSITMRECADVLHEVPSARPDNKVHLCDSCRHAYPECPSEKDDVIFGNGKGNDNVCACNKYEPSTQPEIIRCKDCKYASPNGKYGCKAYHFKLYETHEMKADDFCSRAERRTDE